MKITESKLRQIIREEIASSMDASTVALTPAEEDLEAKLLTLPGGKQFLANFARALGSAESMNEGDDRPAARRYLKNKRLEYIAQRKQSIFSAAAALGISGFAAAFSHYADATGVASIDQFMNMLVHIVIASGLVAAGLDMKDASEFGRQSRAIGRVLRGEKQPLQQGGKLQGLKV